MPKKEKAEKTPSGKPGRKARVKKPESPQTEAEKDLTKSQVQEMSQEDKVAIEEAEAAGVKIADRRGLGVMKQIMAGTGNPNATRAPFPHYPVGGFAYLTRPFRVSPQYNAKMWVNENPYDLSEIKKDMCAMSPSKMVPVRTIKGQGQSFNIPAFTVEPGDLHYQAKMFSFLDPGMIRTPHMLPRPLCPKGEVHPILYTMSAPYAVDRRIADGYLAGVAGCIPSDPEKGIYTHMWCTIEEDDDGEYQYTPIGTTTVCYRERDKRYDGLPNTTVELYNLYVRSEFRGENYGNRIFMRLNDIMPIDSVECGDRNFTLFFLLIGMGFYPVAHIIGETSLQKDGQKPAEYGAYYMVNHDLNRWVDFINVLYSVSIDSNGATKSPDWFVGDDLEWNHFFRLIFSHEYHIKADDAAELIKRPIEDDEEEDDHWASILARRTLPKYMPSMKIRVKPPVNNARSIAAQQRVLAMNSLYGVSGHPEGEEIPPVNMTGLSITDPNGNP